MASKAGQVKNRKRAGSPVRQNMLDKRQRFSQASDSDPWPRLPGVGSSSGEIQPYNKFMGNSASSARNGGVVASMYPGSVRRGGHVIHDPNSVVGALPDEWQQVGFGSLEIPEDASFLPAPHQTPNPTWPGLKEHEQDRLLNNMTVDFDSDFVFLTDVPEHFGYSQANNQRGQSSGNPAAQRSSEFENSHDGTTQNSGQSSALPQNTAPGASNHIEPDAERNESGSAMVKKSSSDPNLAGDAALDKSDDPTPKKQKPRGPFQKAEDREETSLTRKNHACVRCRIQKVRCKADENDPSGVCVTCQKANPTIHKLPCFRSILTECPLYRISALTVTKRWPQPVMVDISDWATNEIKEATIRAYLPDFKFRTQFRKFVPTEGDVLEKTWMDGKSRKSFPVTPYAISDMNETAKDFLKAIDRMAFISFDRIFDRDNSDVIIRATYDMAKQHIKSAPTKEEKVLMQNVLRMAFMVNLSCGTAWLEAEGEKGALDMKPSEDPTWLMKGKVPNPPIVSAQLAIIGTVTILRPLQKLILDELQRMILINKPQTWMTIYLCTFVLLHNCSVLSLERYNNARKHRLEDRRPSLRYTNPRFIEDVHRGVNILLTHFHYNKGDMDPFNIDWKHRHTSRLAHLNPRETGFMIMTSRLAKEKAEEFEMLVEMDQYENELFFVGQLYEKNWMPKRLYESPI